MKLLGSVAIAALFLIGCSPPYVPNGSAYNFDSCAMDGGTDPLCGFILESGTAERVRAFTAGEYGLAMHPGTVISLPLAWGDCYDGAVRFLARCDSGGSIRIDEFIHNRMTSSATVSPGTDWSAQRAQLSGSLALNMQTIPFVRFRVAEIGSASCIIDEVSLSDSTTCP